MWHLILACQSQLRTSFAGVIGLDFPAVAAMAVAHGVDAELTALLLPSADQGLRMAVNKERPKS